jgi:tetratricopeptide (TPR) repeat protein
LLSCCASVGAAQGVATAVRDPDRGLDPALRARLALVDAGQDTCAVECWTASLSEHLDQIAAFWAGDCLLTGLADARWIAPELRVGPLFDVPSASAPENGAWRVKRGVNRDAGPDARTTLNGALAAWRRCFHGRSRLDFEVVGFSGSPPQLDAQIRVCASGVAEGSSVQHNATWTCTWRFEQDGAQLVDLRVDEFEAVALAAGDNGMFADVTESLFEDPRVFRERLAPGLDHWDRVLPATLFPGTLGHHGLAIGDVNGDGLEDLYLCRPGGLPNQLLLHMRQGTLIDASAASGADLLDYSSSALLVDLDGDGDLDLVVATGTGLVFFANDGAGHFERKLLLERSLATSLAAADFDGDGDVDLYVCSYLSPYEKNGLPVPYHDANNGEANQLLRNDGAWNFADVTAAVGLDENNRRFSLAAAWEDFDNDGDQDLYVANDFGRNNLYRNDGGHFRDVAPEFSAEDTAAGMGVTWADVDHDGWMDLYVTNMRSNAGCRLTSQPNFRGAALAMTLQAERHHSQGNSLLLNQAGRGFRDITQASGTAFGRWGWGAIFIDFDNDGAPDLFAPNGFVSGERGPDLDSFFWRQVVLQSPEAPGDAGENYSLGWRAVNRLMRQGYSWNGHERNVAFWNVGNAHFADVSSAIGLDQPDDSRAAARIDWNGDGSEDLVVTNRNGPMLRVLENRQATGNAWVEFELRAKDPAATAIGARVTVETSEGTQLASTLHCGEGYLAQSSSRMHFGLGRAGVKRVNVRWPSGESEDFGAPAPRAAHTLVQGSHAARAIATTATQARPRPSSPATQRDADATRTVLPTPLPMPRIVLETWDGKPASLLGITMQGPQGTGQPLVFVLWSAADAASRRELERVGAAADALRAAGIQQVLALSVDVGQVERERAVAAWKETGWPFARAFISEESLSVLELVQAALHDDAHGLTLPVAFLIDNTGRLVATYQGAFDPEQLRQDLGLFALDAQARRDACVPFPGRWIAPLPQPLDADVAARLIAHGVERPASEYELARVEVREFSAASFEYEIGVARERQGRAADAIQHFQRALAADPTYAPAAQHLAAALQSTGDNAAALTAYKEALKLDPAHAETRCNLGLLYLAMGNIQGAEGELRALRALHSELSGVLETRIRDSQDK